MASSLEDALQEQTQRSLPHSPPSQVPLRALEEDEQELELAARHMAALTIELGARAERTRRRATQAIEGGVRTPVLEALATRPLPSPPQLHDDEARLVRDEAQRAAAAGRLRAAELLRDALGALEAELDVLSAHVELEENTLERCLEQASRPVASPRDDEEPNVVVTVAPSNDGDDAEEDVGADVQAEPDAAAVETQHELAAQPEPAPAARIGRERREQERARLQIDVTMQSEHNFYSGFTSNISEGGLFIATARLLERGSSLELTFTLPGAEPIHATAEVRWTREYCPDAPDVFPGMGVQFVALPVEAEALIKDFMSRRETLFFEP